MAAQPPPWDDQPRLWGRPEPRMPPGLNREQAWAWAMDNFPALCRPSCEASPASVGRGRGAQGLLRRALTGHLDVPGVERRRNGGGQPRVHDPQAESAADPQARAADASARREAPTEAPGATLSPSPPRKRLKSQA